MPFNLVWKAWKNHFWKEISRGVREDGGRKLFIISFRTTQHEKLLIQERKIMKNIWTTKVVGGGGGCRQWTNHYRNQLFLCVSSLRTSNKKFYFYSGRGVDHPPPLIWDMSPKKSSTFFDNLPKRKEGRVVRR